MHTARGGLMDQIDQTTFVVVLVAVQLHPIGQRDGVESTVDLLKGGRTIDLWLSQTKSVEIGAMKDPEETRYHGAIDENPIWRVYSKSNFA
jgi:hypothetical protein